MPQPRAVRNKTYYDKNKQKILNWHKVRVPCSQCGKAITRGAMSKHCAARTAPSVHNKPFIILILFKRGGGTNNVPSPLFCVL